MPQIVRVSLVTTNNDTITLSEKMVHDEDEAWSQYEKLAFDLTGEHKKKPIKVERRFPGEKPA